MTRTGWVILALFVLLGIGLVSMLGGEGPAIQPKTPVVPVIDDPREPADVAPAEIAKIVVPSGLVVPVAGVRPDQLYDSWGDARGGGTRGHQALDIPAPRGTPVLAAAKGRVEKLWQSEAGGTTLYIRSPTGRLSYYYAHLDRYAPGIRGGAVVSAGQPIATVGDSGNAGPGNTHLHFGMSLMAPGDNWAGGRPVNPYPLLAASGGGG
jgi:murein DD-endopeptidase MepM/ murein hydrolase activator NlpD